MAINTENFTKVIDTLEQKVKNFGFEQVKDESGNFFTVSQDETSCVYSGEKGCLKFRYANERAELYYAADIDSLGSAKKLVVSLLSPTGDDRDVNYVVNEMSDSLEKNFGKKAAAPKKVNSKANQTISKAAVKNGSFYDPNTLASKLCLVFPELRDYYKENLDTYGEFLPEEFFTNYGTEKVINAIKQNHPQTMKRLFQILNEIYEDGTNDTQSLIAVTILGELGNDQILLARCVDYMSETMAPPVIEVNRYLATVSGKKAKKKLLDPPAYKPKKQKKPGMFAQMMSGGNGMTPPPTV